LCGEQVEVVARHGRHALRVEQTDGQVRLLPVAWTDLVPRRAALIVNGRPVRLAPTALRELSAWVAVRIRHGPLEKLDSPRPDARELKLDAAATDGAAGRDHNGEPLTLVEQAGPPRADRRNVQQKRGRR
jgi:hypothetical protein